jgi:hypothetical protein
MMTESPVPYRGGTRRGTITPRLPIDQNTARTKSRGGWAVQKLCEVHELSALAESVRDSLPIDDSELDIEWLALAEGRPIDELLVLIQRDGARLIGAAPFLRSILYLDYSVCGLSLYKKKIRGLRIKQGPITIDQNPTAACADSFKTLATIMDKAPVVYVESVAADSATHHVVADSTSPIHQDFHVVPLNAEDWHCRIRWDGNVENYLKSIGGNSRRDFKRRSRKLFLESGVKCEVRCFQSMPEVDDFLRDGVEVSDKTWQKQKLGDGLSRGGPLERKIRFAAQRGAFLGYVLYAGGKPVAFDYGFLYRDVCSMEAKGYDPAWADYRVGTVLFFEILRDFEAKMLPVRFIDYLTMFSSFKLRTTNDKRRIQSFYLFRKSPLGSLYYYTFMPVHRTSRALVAILERMRIKDKAKRLLGQHVSE